MALLAITYPTLDKNDFDFIQQYRAENDPLFYSVVDPHFTLVFPTEYLTEEDFVAEITEKAQNAYSFDVTLRAATINKDAFGGFFHEFLVPDQGNADLIKLHDLLYSEKLSTELRLDIDFIPHLGIGNGNDPTRLKNRVDELNTQNIEVSGRIEQIDVVRFENNSITSIAQIQLSSP